MISKLLLMLSAKVLVIVIKYDIFYIKLGE